jgi:hypothetical protein
VADDFALAPGEVDASASWLMSVLTPGCRVLEMSDLGFTGGLGFAVFTVGRSDFLATKGCCGAGLDFVTAFVFGGRAFLSVFIWIFLRTIFGVAALSAGWSQLSKTLKKPIKQAKLQMMMRYFFIVVKSIFCKDVKTRISYQFIFFSFSFSSSF